MRGDQLGEAMMASRACRPIVLTPARATTCLGVDMTEGILVKVMWDYGTSCKSLRLG